PELLVRRMQMRTNRLAAELERAGDGRDGHPLRGGAGDGELSRREQRGDARRFARGRDVVVVVLVDQVADEANALAALRRNEREVEPKVPEQRLRYDRGAEDEPPGRGRDRPLDRTPRHADPRASLAFHQPPSGVAPLDALARERDPDRTHRAR